MTERLGAKIGEAFVAKHDGADISGAGNYCGFPIALRLVPAERNGLRGYDIAIHIAPPTTGRSE